MIKVVSLRTRLLGLAIALFLGGIANLHAQFKVELDIGRRLFVLYEPIVATVKITNLTGREVILQDTATQPWFGFQITTPDGGLVPPINLDYHLQPLTIGSGETLQRKVNLTTLYAIRDFGLYRIRASIHFADLEKFFSSNEDSVELTEGRTIWEQTVGVPVAGNNGGGYRTVTLLTHRLPSENMLYVRVIDRDAGQVLLMQKIGRLVMGLEPSIQLDSANRLHVLQLIGPKTYIYTRVGPNGEWLGQSTIMAVKERPSMRRLASGEVVIKGGVLDQPVDTTPGAGPAASPRQKLSERPPGMPR